MAVLTPTKVPVDAGVTLTGAAADVAGDEAPIGTNRFLYVANGSAGAITVTVATPGGVSGLAIADAQMTVAAGAAGIIPLSRLFAGTNGRAAITYTAVTSVTVAVFELGR